MFSVWCSAFGVPHLAFGKLPLPENFQLVNLHKFCLNARKEVNFDYITNRKLDLILASFAKITNACGRSVQRIGTQNGTQKTSV